MNIHLPYGKKGTTVNVPEKNLAGILRPAEYKAKEDPESLIKNALKNPEGTKTLTEIVKAKKRKELVAIAVDDHTRPCPTDEILPPLLDELYAAGVKDENILIARCIQAPGHHQAGFACVTVAIGDDG